MNKEGFPGLLCCFPFLEDGSEWAGRLDGLGGGNGNRSKSPLLPALCPLSFLVFWRCGAYRWILHSFAFSYYNNSLKIHSWRGGQDAAKCEVVFWEYSVCGGGICGQNGCLKMTRALHLYLILWILCCAWFRVDPTHQLPIYLLKKIYIFPIYCFEDETMQASTQTKSLTKGFDGL